jgi:hypothetical protein
MIFKNYLLVMDGLHKTYTDFLKKTHFVSYMGWKSYENSIKIWKIEWNCHILCTLLQDYLLKNFLEIQVSVIWPWKDQSLQSIEYKYHTAVLVCNQKNNISYLLDPWWFFIDPIVLDIDSQDYQYRCLGHDRITNIYFNNNTIIHRTLLKNKKELTAVLCCDPIDNIQIEELFTEHQKYESDNHIVNKPQRKFTYFDKEKWFVIE